MTLVYTPIRFGMNNQVPNATLTSTPAPETETPLDNLKNEWRARQVVWDDPGGDVVITGTHATDQVAEYFALPGSNLIGKAEVKIELLDELGDPIESFSMDYQQLSDLKPLGEWRVGIDPFGVPEEIDRPDVFAYWFDAPKLYRSWRLTITQSEFTDDPLSNVRLRMIHIGVKVQMDINFSHDSNAITFLTEPELVQTNSGSFIPSRAQTKARRMSLSLDAMTPADRARLWRMESTLKGTPFIVSAYPSAKNWMYSNYTFLARFSSALTFKHSHYAIHETQMTLVEV